MDLASILSEGIEAASACQKPPVKRAAVPAVPAQVATSGNGQVIDNNSSSRSSRCSRPKMPWEDEVQELIAQACARVPAGERARSYPVWGREQREQREQPARSDTYSSRSLFLKRELREKTGTDALPARSNAANAVPAPPTFDERAASLEYECGLSRAEAQAKAETTIIPAGKNAPTLTADGLAVWRAGLARLDYETAPCPGYRSDEWRNTLARAVAFLAQFGAQAEAFGWTASRLFGVHAVAGIVRVDACGALTLPVSGEVRAITATEVRFAHLTHRQKPGQPAGVPWWELGRRSPPPTPGARPDIDPATCGSELQPKRYLFAQISTLAAPASAASFTVAPPRSAKAIAVDVVSTASARSSP